MKILSWNCRGLRTPRTIRELRHFVETSRPQIVALVETRCGVQQLDAFRVQLGFSGCFGVASKGRSGGLAVFWRDTLDVDVLNFSFYHIDFLVTDVSRSRYTLFYGCPNWNGRSKSWDLLCRLKYLSPHPWCLLGDFNEVLRADEVTRCHAIRKQHIDQFSRAVTSCNLIDLGFLGGKFTYSNKRKGIAEIKCRLDRALVTPSWLTRHPNSTVTHLPSYSSDHKCLLIDITTKQWRPRQSFRFERMWLRDATFKNLVAKEWKQLSSTTNSFSDNLKRLQCKIKQWDKTNFGSVKAKIKNLQHQLADIQEHERTNHNVDRELAISKEIDEWLKREEILWHQRSRITWLAEGDNNTKYFHACATARHRSTLIRALQRQDGTLTSEISEMMDIASSFYCHLFTSALTAHPDDITRCVQLIPKKILPQHNAILLAPYSEEEVTRALYQMHPSKAPGLDGFSTGFFQSSWHTVKAEFIHECLKFLNQGYLDPKNNISVLTLIPKKRGATNISEFRPISLIGVLAKVISKAIANRLQGILDEVISSDQCAFIKNRLISDNLIIAQEVSHFIHRATNSSQVYASLKLDMAKAYDRVELPFLEMMMKQMGFATVWVDQLMLYLKSASYCVRVNGVLSAPICPSRGLRQGDPLSPYLFIICAEWFSYTLRHYDQCGLIEGIKIHRRAPALSHLLFADDALLFMKVNSSTLRAVHDVLQTYEYISGQSVNFTKSEMVVSKNASVEFIHEVNQVLGVRIVPILNKYLGLPVQMCIKKTETFIPILEKLQSKVQGWQSAKLSVGGKEVLITPVLNSVPQYWLSTFFLPVQTITKIQSIINRFWWSTTTNQKGVHWVRKEILMQSKEDGGLGFKDWRCLNLAFLSKQAWRLQSQPDLLVNQIMKAKYFPNSSILDASLGYRPSHVWSSIFKALPILQHGTIRCRHTGILTWNHPPTGIFTIKTAYNLSKLLQTYKNAEQGEPSDRSKLHAFWKTLWKLPLPKKIKIFAWKAYLGALPTGKQKVKHHLGGHPTCPICEFSCEDDMHALVNCWWADSVWNMHHICGTEHFTSFASIADLLFFCYQHMHKPDLVKVILTCWYIWYHRNVCLHKGMPMTPRLAFYKILSLLSDFHSNSTALITESVSNALEWIGPPPNYVKINCDASWSIEEGKGAIAAWVQDSQSLTLAIRYRPIAWCKDVPDAEGQAMRLG